MSALNTTTLSAELSATATQITLASLATLAVNQTIVVNREAMVINAPLPTSALLPVNVQRGAAGTQACSHPSGATAYTGNSSLFYSVDPVGIPPTYPEATPWINLTTGVYWDVSGSAWVPIGGGVSAGNVVGPASATDGGFALFDGATGRLLKNSAAIVPTTKGGTGAASLKAAGIVAAANLKQALIAGGVAGNFAVTGVAVGDQLVSVIYYVGAGVAVTDVANLTSEFTISGTNQINNTAGTDTTGGKLLVTWVDLT